jgi:cephalosporin hydroxylase
MIAWLKRLHARIYWLRPVRHIITKYFHRLFYYTPPDQKVWTKTLWLGKPVWKCPFDLWIYQEILFEPRPDVIVELGTGGGGSALFLASICDLIGHGRVVSVDIQHIEDRPVHERITYVAGLDTSDSVVSNVRSMIRPGERVLLVLDSGHDKADVLEQLRSYGDLVSIGSYIVVEDTNINGHPVSPFYGPGPMEAVKEFINDNTNFVIDQEREKYYLTFNPCGYLKRIR